MPPAVRVLGHRESVSVGVFEQKASQLYELHHGDGHRGDPFTGALEQSLKALSSSLSHSEW